MKKNEKGFTLIELLAVIVILAVIALIATPIVMNVINRSRQKAAEDSTYGVIEAVKTYHAEKMLDVSATVKDTISVEFQSDGKAKIDNAASATEFKMSGSRPTAGTVSIDENGLVKVENLKINGYTCSSKTNKTDTNATAGANIICENK